ncbi:MAG: SpoIID/LytB domain-containing protein [Planctomycetes bacterium]|nr:SpoIID/LytB domain-containing protein [Planctomycetota bacterium]
MRLRWILFLLICLCAGGLLLRLIREEQILVSDEEYPLSPTIRVHLSSRKDQLEIKTRGTVLEVSMPMSDKPLIWDGKKSDYRYLIQRKQGRFIWGAGFADNVPWIEFKPAQGRLEIEEGSYPGSLRLYPQGEESMVLVNHVPLELYVGRVIQGESRLSWPQETLKAQAVAARTYAFYQMQKRRERIWDLTAGSRSQAYAGFDPGLPAHRATLSTLALVLTQNDEVIPAYYVSTCGGHTTRVELAFPSAEPLPALAGVDCPFCVNSPYFQWQARISLTEALSLLRVFHRQVSSFSACRVGSREGLRAGVVIFDTLPDGALSIASLDFRRRVNALKGRELVKSLNFEVSIVGEELVIDGKGWGYHGVGLCQYGSCEMGRRNAFFTEILSYYYPGASLKAAYRLPVEERVKGGGDKGE